MASPLRAIRAKCLDCCCFNSAEVRRCTVEKCPLYGYRMGHKPKGDTDTLEDIEDDNAPGFMGDTGTETAPNAQVGKLIALGA